MSANAAELDRLSALTDRQIEQIARDLNEPKALRAAAREVLTELSERSLRDAIADFERATPIFADFATRLGRIAEASRTSSGSGAVAALTKTIGDLSGAYAAIGDMIQRPLEEAELLVNTEAARTTTSGRVLRSTAFADVAGEFQAMFDRAIIDDKCTAAVGGQCRTLLSNRALYRAVEEDVVVPFALVGVIHGMMSAFRLDRRLDKDEALPKGGADAANGLNDPWLAAAADALRGHRMHLIDDWTLPRQLYEVERFFGFGHRYRRVPSPYVWGASDQYRSGDFCEDGTFDPDAISPVIGAAAMLKMLSA